jgi:ATP-dependent DNA helicase RecQ
MKDQVEILWRYGFKAGQVNSACTPAENSMTLTEWESGNLNFMYVAPERLQDDKFCDLMRRIPPDLVAIDEAHAASDWSDSFRPDYKKIGDLIVELKPKSVLALTATATPEVEEDIRRIFHLGNATRVLYLPSRENLHLSSETFTNPQQIYRAIESIDGSTICYCATVKKVAHYGASIRGGALCYHGKMTASERDASQNAFMQGNVRVMFATNAFGLGINKSDIRGIVHADVPASLDALTQESGRCGRDGKDAWCTAFFHSDAYNTQMYFINMKYPPKEVVERVFAYLQRIANKDGICKATIESIAGHCGGSQKESVGAAVSILTNFKVLERSNDSDSLTSVKFLKPHLQEQYARYPKEIEKIGFTNEVGFIEFNATNLAEALGLKPVKVRETLKELDKNGYIKWAPPFRGKTTKIIGGIELVDFEYLKRRRKLAIEKLETVFQYHRVPSENKHAYIADYFRGELQALESYQDISTTAP